MPSSQHASTERRVYSVSALPAPAGQDRTHRLRGYLVSMGIRTLCFALAGFFVLGPEWMWPAWVCVVGAVVLPYPAVVLANNTNRRVELEEFASPYQRALPPGVVPADAGVMPGGGEADSPAGDNGDDPHRPTGSPRS